MRKILWGCAALAITAVGGIYFGADWAARHPDTWMGRLFLTKEQLGQANLAQARNPRVTQAGLVLKAHDSVKHTLESQEPPVPSKTAHVDPPPALLPGPIVIKGTEDGEIPDSVDPCPSRVFTYYEGGIFAKQAPMPPVRDLIGIKPGPGNAEAGEMEDSVMPRAEDDLVAPMPYAEELGSARRLDKAGLKEPAHKGQSMKRDGEERTRHPSVDTTEFRPSDGRFTKDLRGPF